MKMTVYFTHGPRNTGFAFFDSNQGLAEWLRRNPTAQITKIEYLV
jgi:hypothetical protein